ncbi:RDD family protein [Promicromonospora sp. Marseille-Q5078]
MTTTCTACGAAEQSGAFCSVCGTPTVATAYRTPGPPTGSLEVTTEPEMRELTRRAPADVRAASGAPQHGEPPLAGVGRRAGAYVLDLLAISLVAGVAGAITALAVRLLARMSDLAAATTRMGQDAAASELVSALTTVYLVVGLVSLLCWVGLALWEGRTGRTVGNSLLGIRTVAVDGGPVGAGRDLLRWLVLAACGILPVVGTVLVLVSPTFDSSGRRQGWQDKAARSVVRDVRGVAPRSFAPASPAAPGAPAPAGQAHAGQAAADPWAFPAAQRDAGGLITGVPGSADGAPAQEDPAGVEAHTVHRGQAPAETPAPRAPSPQAPAPRSPHAHESAPATMQAPVLPVAPVAPVAPPAEDLDDLEATRFSVSSRRSAGDGTAPPRIVVEIDADRRVHVATRTLVGRQPQQDGGAPATLLRLDDPTRSVSKTHLELQPAADGLRVTDLGSTNGSAVIAPGGGVQELAAGRPVTVTAGWVVQAGARRLTVVGQDAGA